MRENSPRCLWGLSSCPLKTIFVALKVPLWSLQSAALSLMKWVLVSSIRYDQKYSWNSFCRPTPTITPSKCLCIKGLSDGRCCPNRYQTGTKEVPNRYYWGVVRLAFALYLYLADFCRRYFHQRYLLGTCLLPVWYLFCEQVPCLKRPVYRHFSPVTVDVGIFWTKK